MRKIILAILCMSLLWFGWGFSLRIGEQSLSIEINGIKNIIKKNVDK
jgi:ammonia channel protein AmtB